MSSAAERVSVIILNWNGGEVFLECLRSVREQEHAPCEVIVVDNGSNDYSREQVARIAPQAVQVVHPANVGYCAGMNSGVARARGDYVWLLNNDVVLAPNALAELSAGWTNAARDVAGLFPKVVYFDAPDRVNACGATFDLWRLWRRQVDGQLATQIPNQPRRIFGDIFVAPCFQRRVLLEAGGFDERFFSHSEDIDLSLRLNLLGYRLLTAPQVVVRHRMSHATRTNPVDRLKLHFRNIRNYSVAVLSSVQPHNLARACAALAVWLWLVGTARAAVRFRAGPLRLARAYAAAMVDVVQSIPWLVARRAAIQRTRRVPDRQLWRI